MWAKIANGRASAVAWREANMSDVDLQDKFQGAMLGVAIGDAIGSPFSGWESVSRKTFEGREDDPARLAYTDETHLTVGVAESLVDRRAFDAGHMAGVLLRNYGEEPWRRYGPRAARFFELMREGAGWEEAGRAASEGGAEGIDAAARRVVPVALFAHGDPAVVAVLAKQVGRVTDPGGWTLESGVLLALAVAMALPLPPVKRLNKSAYLRSLRQHLDDPVAMRFLDCVEGLLPDSPPRRVAEYLRQVAPPPHTVPAAMYAFLRCPESFHEAVYYAISLGGDTDTTGSMAGALAGAFLGSQLIPPLWRREVEGSRLMRRLADSLIQAASHVTQGTGPSTDPPGQRD
jgi:poly(ADP-ribose) glycohydrolase ARH3